VNVAEDGDIAEFASQATGEGERKRWARVPAHAAASYGPTSGRNSSAPLVALEARSRTESGLSEDMAPGSEHTVSAHLGPYTDSLGAAFAAKRSALSNGEAIKVHIQPRPAVREPTSEVAEEEELHIGLFTAGPQPAAPNETRASPPPSDIDDDESGDGDESAYSRSCI